MRIELNAGGLGGLISIAKFSEDYDKLLSKTNSVISSFKAVKRKTVNISGGVGNLQGALDQIDSRIKTEEAKVEKLEAVGKKFGEFLANTVKTDKSVANLVNVNKEEFYQVNPWARPPAPPREKNFLEKAGEWLCEKGKEFADTIHKCYEGIKKFCKEHAAAIKKIVVGVLVIGTLAVLTAVTGGAAAAVFTVALKGAIVGGLASAAVSGTMGAVSQVKKNVSEGKDAFDGVVGAAFDSAASGFMGGAIGGAFSGAAGAVGPLLSSAGMSTGGAAALHIFAGGASSAIGGAASTATEYLIDEGTLKGHGKEILVNAGIDFLTGMATTGIETGIDHVKYKSYNKIQSKIKSGDANWFERTIATNKLVSKGYKSMIKDGVWTGSRKLANHAMGDLMDKSFKTIIKDTGKKIIKKTYENLPQIINEDFSYKLPKISNFAETTIENIGEFYKDKFVNAIPSKPLIVPFTPKIEFSSFINIGFHHGGVSVNIGGGIKVGYSGGIGSGGISRGGGGRSFSSGGGRGRGGGGGW